MTVKLTVYVVLFCNADCELVLFLQYLRYLTDCIRGEYWDRVLVRHPELRMYNTVVKKFEIFQAQVRNKCTFFFSSCTVVLRVSVVPFRATFDFWCRSKAYCHLVVVM